MTLGPVLAIETATVTGGVALVDEHQVRAEFLLDVRATYAERLLPTVESLLRAAGLTVDELAGIAVSLGPGSFTGLRIGLATAQGLAFASGLPLVGVGTLEAMAWNLWGSRQILVPVLDARRGEVYGAAYVSRAGDDGQATEEADAELDTVLSPRAWAPEELAREVAEAARIRKAPGGILIGPGVGLLRPHLDSLAPGAWRCAPSHLGLPRPAAVGELGRRALVRGKFAPPEGLAPLYLRPAAAELGRASTAGVDRQGPGPRGRGREAGAC